MEQINSITVHVPTLIKEAEWLERAVANARKNFPGRYSEDYLKGFEAAAGWVRHHIAMEKEGEDGTETAPATSPPGESKILE